MFGGGVASSALTSFRTKWSCPNGTIRATPPSQLSRRGDRAYVKDGMALPPQQISISKVELNRQEKGLEIPAGEEGVCDHALVREDADATSIALIVDRAWGEPPTWMHPVVGMGRYLGWFKLTRLPPALAFIITG